MKYATTITRSSSLETVLQLETRKVELLGSGQFVLGRLISVVRRAKCLDWAGVTSETDRIKSDDPLSCVPILGRLRLQSTRKGA